MLLKKTCLRSSSAQRVNRASLGCTQGGGTALHLAASLGSTDIVALLLGRNANLEALDASACTPVCTSLLPAAAVAWGWTLLSP